MPCKRVFGRLLRSCVCITWCNVSNTGQSFAGVVYYFIGAAIVSNTGVPSVKKVLAWRKIFKAFSGLFIKIFMRQTIL
jgi:hypothetical protein